MELHCEFAPMMMTLHGAKQHPLARGHCQNRLCMLSEPPLHVGHWFARSLSVLKQVLFLILQDDMPLSSPVYTDGGASLHVNHLSMRQVVLGYMLPVADTVSELTSKAVNVTMLMLMINLETLKHKFFIN